MRQKVCSLLIASLLGAAAAYATGAAKNVCIKSDNGSGQLRINLETGEYELCLADHRSFGGKLSPPDPVDGGRRETFPGGRVAVFPPVRRSPPDRSASVVVTLGDEIIILLDEDTANNDCSCQTPASFGTWQGLIPGSPIIEVAVAPLGDGTATTNGILYTLPGQLLFAQHNWLSGEVGEETLLGTGDFLFLDLEQVNGVSVAAAVKNFQLMIWRIDNLGTPGSPVNVGPADTLSTGIASLGPNAFGLWRSDFSGNGFRTIRRTSDLGLQQSLPSVNGVGTAWWRHVQPGVAGDGNGGFLVVKNPLGTNQVFALCSENGVDGPPILVGHVPGVPSPQVLEPAIQYNPFAGDYDVAVGIGERLLHYKVDCGAGAARPVQEGVFWTPPGARPYNGLAVVPGGDGQELFAHCHGGLGDDDGRMIVQWLDGLLNRPPGLVVGPECTPGDVAVDPRYPGLNFGLHYPNSLDHVEVHLAPPDPPAGPWLTSGELPGFEVKARITAGSASIAGRKEADCIAETLCISGAVAGRPEIFARAPGPKPNGHLWPTLAKFSTSRVEVWMRQPRTGTLRYYLLEEVAAGEQLLDLAGLAHKTGFLPPFDAAASSAGAAATTSSEAAALAPLAVDLAAASRFVAAAPAAGDPPAPAGPWLTANGLPGFRAKVRISDSLDGRKENDCIAETLCVSGAVAGRPEVFVRVVGPKPNGFLWPTLVKFSTSRVEVWIEQTSTGVLRYYDLPAVAAGEDLLELAGVADKLGFAG